MKKNSDENNFCIRCGSALGANAKFCSECGEKINIQKEQEIIEEKDIEKITKTSRKKNIDNHENNEKKEKIYDEKEIKHSNINESFERNKKYIYPAIAVVITLVICLGVFTCFYQYYLKNLVIETTKREVTVTDTGISESVEKVYDSVVVVESYVKGKLYATGTGVVYKTDDKNGYILTNSHVISSADTVKVVFTNNEREEVEIVGNDSYSDMAVLGVSKDKIISVAEIGSSEELKVGDTAFAVGAPLDSETYAWTVTRGIISGKNRTVSVSTSDYSSSSYVMEVLQTDAAINSGNSGGPLCNSNGEVIGITNMKLASSTIEGMGFAIPIETAVKYADKFISGESVSYPYLGVTVYDASATSYFGFSSEKEGIYVEYVEDDSPADKGGIKKGDRILKINNTEIEDVSFFKYELYKYNVGDEVKITVERDGKEKVLTVTLGSSNPSA